LFCPYDIVGECVDVFADAAARWWEKMKRSTPLERELKVDGAAQKGLQLWRESALGAAVECYLIFTSAADPRAKCHHTEGR
jgi:hypothetical protein